ncbi:MAG: DUF998 domain-containing protein [bacterium]|jgi:hypothetical protein|nr:DUF998 domain-containing protein [bacterium]
MKRILIKQGIFLPLIYFVAVIIAGFFARDYSHWGQHASELALNAVPAAATIFNIGAAITGISLILLGLGFVLNYQRRFLLTAILTVIFGITFLFGAIFKIGSPLHGLYGIGMCVMLIPFVFLYEQKGMFSERAVHAISLSAGLLMFLYLWSMVAGLDPVQYRGITQRLFAIVVFGWFSFIAWKTGKAKTTIPSRADL